MEFLKGIFGKKESPKPQLSEAEKDAQWQTVQEANRPGGLPPIDYSIQKKVGPILNDADKPVVRSTEDASRAVQQPKEEMVSWNSSDIGSANDLIPTQERQLPPRDGGQHHDNVINYESGLDPAEISREGSLADPMANKEAGKFDKVNWDKQKAA